MKYAVEEHYSRTVIIGWCGRHSDAASGGVVLWTKATRTGSERRQGEDRVLLLAFAAISCERRRCRAERGIANAENAELQLETEVFCHVYKLEETSYTDNEVLENAGPDNGLINKDKNEDIKLSIVVHCANI